MRYFGYDIPDDGSNSGASGSGDHHTYSHNVYDSLKVTIKGGVKEFGSGVVSYLRKALYMLDDTNGELITQPSMKYNYSKNKHTIPEEHIAWFKDETKKYNPDGNNKYRRHLEEYKAQIKRAEQPTSDTLAGEKKEQKTKIKKLIKDIDSVKKDLKSMVDEVNSYYKEFPLIYKLLKENNDDKDEAFLDVLTEIPEIYGQITVKANKLDEISTGKAKNMLSQDKDDKLSLDELSSIYNELMQLQAELSNHDGCLEIIELQDKFNNKMKAFQEGLNKVIEKHIEGIPKKAQELAQRIDLCLPYLAKINSSYNQIIEVLRDDENGAINEEEYKSKLSEFKSTIEMLQNVVSKDKKEEIIKRSETIIQESKESTAKNGDIYCNIVSFENYLAELENQADNAIGKQSEKIIDFSSEIAGYYDELITLDRFNPDIKQKKQLDELNVKLEELGQLAEKLIIFEKNLSFLQKWYESKQKDLSCNRKAVSVIGAILMFYSPLFDKLHETRERFDRYRKINLAPYNHNKKESLIRFQKKVESRLNSIKKYYSELELTDTDFVIVQQFVDRIKLEEFFNS